MLAMLILSPRANCTRVAMNDRCAGKSVRLLLAQLDYADLGDCTAAQTVARTGYDRWFRFVWPFLLCPISYSILEPIDWEHNDEEGWWKT